MVPDDTSPLDSGQFVGMLSVLKKPFRIVLCGVTHNGRRFHGVVLFSRLSCSKSTGRTFAC